MIGLPTLEISFRKAAETIANRTKAGIVTVIIRDTASSIRTIHSARDIPSTYSKENQNTLREALLGGRLGAPSAVIVAVLPVTPVGEDDLGDLLENLGPYQMDYICLPADASAEEISKLTEWVKELRSHYRTNKAVVANTAANDKGVINVALAEDTCTISGTARNSASLCARIAGILAGIPSTASATYANLPEVTSVKQCHDPNAEVDAGKLFLIHDGTTAKIARAVNSLTTIPNGGKEDWKKIKIVENMDLISYYCRTTIENEYIGRSNSYHNKLVLVTALSTFLTTLEDRGILKPGGSTADIDVDAQQAWLKSQGIDTSEMTQQEIKEANTGSHVFLTITVSILDAMEDFVVNIGV